MLSVLLSLGVTVMVHTTPLATDSITTRLAITQLACDDSAAIAQHAIAPLRLTITDDPHADSRVVLDSTPDSTARRPRQRAVAVEYSDWYTRRLTIHRWASYTTIPLFAAQYITGEQLIKHGRDATFATKVHGPTATAVAGLFGINTLTGLWNLADSRHDPSGRTRRYVHSLLMLAADAGFVVTGVLSGEAENSSQKRQLHKQVAIVSMGVSLVSYAIMLPPFRGGD